MICVMVEEDVVSYDLAVMLRDKGFNEPCMTLYNIYGIDVVEFGYADDSPLRNCDSDVCLFIGDRCDDGSFVFVTAPTYGHVMKWLRVVHNIHICFAYDDKSRNRNYEWSVYCGGVKYDSKEYGTYAFFDVYEEACADAVRYVVNNLI